MSDSEGAPGRASRWASPMRYSHFLIASAASVPFNLVARIFFSRMLPFELAMIPSHLAGVLVAFALTRAFVFSGSQTPVGIDLKRFAIVNVGLLLITIIVASFALRVLIPLTNFTFYPGVAAHMMGLVAAAAFFYFVRPGYLFRGTALRGWRSSISTYTIFLVLCTAFVVLARIYTLAMPEPYNIDEAQWAVSARRVLTDWVVWRSSDLTTSGPLNAVVIGWPSLLGVTPSIISSRFTGVVLLASCVFMLGSLVRRGEGFGMGAAAVVFLAAYLGFSSANDLIHYSSELLSITLIAAFGGLYVDLPSRANWRWLLCGLIATSLPFAKLQSAVFCVLFHAACVAALGWRAYSRQPWLRPFLAYLLGAALPVIVLVVPAFLVGEQKAFLDGYLGLGEYIGQHTFQVFEMVSPFLVVMAVLWVAILAVRFRRPGSVERWDILILSIAIWPAALLSVWLPGRPFLHYAFYLFVPLPLSIVLFERSLRSTSDEQIVIGRRLALSVATIGVVWLGSVSLTPLKLAYSSARQDAAFRMFPSDGVVRRPLFAWTGASQGDRMFMWGWEPRITAFAELASADRAAHAEYLIRPNRQRDYLRGRLLRDIALVPPAIVVDANRPGNFFGNFADYKPENFHIDEFPELKKIVDAGYVQIAGDDERTTFYLRKELAAGLRASEIPLKASDARLTDNYLTERPADGGWIDFDPSTSVEADLSAPEPIQEIWVLASRGGYYRQRGSTRIALDIETADGVSRKDVALFNYPSWTVIPVDISAPVISVRVTSLESVGEGPALNEIKAFRTRRSAGG